MANDTKAILQELRAIRTLLEIVVKQTAPKREPDDFDYEAYANDTINKLPTEKVAEMKRTVDRRMARRRRRVN